MADELITKKIPVQRINPRILLLYAKPKMGKTEVLTTLDNCLVLATEPGIEMYEAQYYRITSISGPTTYHTEGELKGQIKTTSLDHVYEIFVSYAQKYAAANGGKLPPPPFKYIAIDTVDELEDMCIVSATNRYKNSVIGKTFEGTSVMELPKGLGYWYIREEVTNKIELIGTLCKYVILISHVKEKVLDKGGMEITSTEISLTGKLSQIVCAAADAIGYLYREPGKSELMVSFQTFENNGVMGARFKRLAGKKMPFSWDSIYIPEPGEKA